MGSVVAQVAQSWPLNKNFKEQLNSAVLTFLALKKYAFRNKMDGEFTSLSPRARTKWFSKL